MRVAEAVETDAQTERELRRLSKGRRVEARVKQRASIILLAAQGWQNKEIADEVKLDRRQVALWRRRFMEGGLPALLQDAPRTGRTPSVMLAVESLILSRTLHEKPATATHWSSRGLASHLGLSATTIRRVWQRHGIQPHLQDAFKVSRDPSRFEDKLIDVVGLYMNPRGHALVLSYGEKSRTHTLSRARSPRAGAATKDHKRNGMTTLFAALNTLYGAVTSMRQDRDRHEEWLEFLRLIERKTPHHLQLHLIVDDDATQEHPKVQAWLARHPRVVMHMTPHNVSWLNVVKRFFRGIAEHRISRDSFTSVAELQQAMAQYIGHRHKPPRPFIWSASALGIARFTRPKATLAPAR
jgi:transposase